MKRFLALTIAVSMMFYNLAYASQFSIDTELSHGLTYIESTITLPDGKPQHTYVLEYKPGLSSLPIVAYGDKQIGRKTLLKLEELYDGNVVAGVNADFFSFYTGIPLGCLIDNGRFLSSSVKNNALAILPDGTLEIGNPDIQSTITYGESAFDFYYNKYPQIYSLYLLDNTYSDSTESEFNSLELVLIPESDVLTINSSTICTVAEIYDNTTDTPIPEGAFVLNVSTTHTAYNVLKDISIGDTLTISVTGSPIWQEAKHVIGGGDIIAKDFKFIPETVDEYSDKVRNARTAVGIRADGSAVFFAVNGKRENYSSGMTLQELAETLISMGAEIVMNLDGGGSTTVGIRELGEDEFHVVNFPTDGYPRAVSNAILFLNTASSDGKVTNVSLFPSFYFALPNTELVIEEKFFDSSMMPVEHVNHEYVKYFPLSEGVEFIESSLFIKEEGEFERRVGAKYMTPYGTWLSDEKTIYVPDTLDSLQIVIDNQVLNIGESGKVFVNAEYYGFEVKNSLNSFSWSFKENNVEELSLGVLAENDVARLNSDGTLTILTDELFKTTTLFASYADKSTEIEIYVGLNDMVLDDFEDADTILTEDESLSEDSTPVDTLFEEELPIEEIVEEREAGYKSDFAKVLPNGFLTYDEPLEISIRPEAIKIMLKGEYTSPAFITIINSEGEEILLPYTISQDFSKVSGWTELEATVPDDIPCFYVKSPYKSSFEDRVVVDTLIATYGFKTPVFEDIADSWAKDNINSVYDMGLIGGYEENGKVIYAPDREITRAEFAKLVSKYLNYELQSKEDILLSFNDNSQIPEWSVPYIDAVSQNKIMKGRPEGDGTLTFAPNAPITRTETMVVLSRIIPEITEKEELTFEDNDAIPNWAIEEIESVVASGIIRGYDDNTIRPDNNITRAEVATVFLRLYTHMYPTLQDDVTENMEFIETPTESVDDSINDNNTEMPIIPV